MPLEDLKLLRLDSSFILLKLKMVQYVLYEEFQFCNSCAV